jgi:hypothetical protein
MADATTSIIPDEFEVTKIRTGRAQSGKSSVFQAAAKAATSWEASISWRKSSPT